MELRGTKFPTVKQTLQVRIVINKGVCMLEISNALESQMESLKKVFNFVEKALEVLTFFTCHFSLFMSPGIRTTDLQIILLIKARLSKAC